MTLPDRIPLTAIILTLNESVNITQCLSAITRIDDVVLVDSGSTDTTLELARAARPDVRIFYHLFQDFGDQRNWALDETQPKHAWVLFVDADEFCDSELLDEIAAFIEKPGKFVGGYIAGRNYFLGRWLKYSSYYPSYQLRLLRLGEVRYRKEGHGQREVTNGSLIYLRHGWRHEGFSKGVEEWISRHNRYSSNDVELFQRLCGERIVWRGLVSWDPILRRRALKQLVARMPLRPLARFLYAYLIRRGFLDGYPGFLFCLLKVAHDLHIVVKYNEYRWRESNSRLP